MDRVQWMVAAAVLLVAGLGGWWFGGAPEPPPPLRVTEAAAAGTVTVHVAGEVAHPGLVEVAAGSRVADAVAGAGGLLTTADPTGLNLAAPVVDGQQVVVRAVGQTMAPDTTGRVHLNTAAAADLESIPGVGPVLAARIVAFRAENGPFATAEDLLGVAGIGEAKLAAMRDAVVVP
ncbi:MAG: ComEA family DNA-binding protein [Acidimicrobiia bacterium]|nr:ComEA family DNA-binding protein [Acidimicrobiia bacterium]